MFSSRTSWSHEKNALTQLLEEKQRRGEPIIDLTLSNPTVASFNTDANQILLPLADPSSLIYAPHPFGLEIARNAIAEFYRRQAVSIDPANILLTSSTSEAYSYLFRLLCNPGDGVLIPKPSYPLFEFLAQLHDIALQPYRLNYDGEWHVDVDSIQQAITPASRAIILLHPNNPTGSFISSHERETINDLAASRELPLIVDEVFHSYSFGGNPPSFVSNRGVLTFTLNGLSKLFGLPQMKLAWTVLNGPEHLVAESRRKLEIIADTLLSVNTPVQNALPSYFDHLTERTDQIRRRVKENYSKLQSLAGGSMMTVLRCDGGWSAILRLPSTQSDEMWAMQLLDRRGILVHPGHLFGFENTPYLVISLLPPPELFQSALQNIRDHVEKGFPVDEKGFIH